MLESCKYGMFVAQSRKTVSSSVVVMSEVFLFIMVLFFGMSQMCMLAAQRNRNIFSPVAAWKLGMVSVQKSRNAFSLSVVV